MLVFGVFNGFSCGCDMQFGENDYFCMILAAEYMCLSANDP